MDKYVWKPTTAWFILESYISEMKLCSIGSLWSSEVYLQEDYCCNKDLLPCPDVYNIIHFVIS